jgi:hypothetical protein
MRRKTGLLITANGEPEGGQWNLDKENRAPPKRGLNYPEPMHFTPDEITGEVLTIVAERFAVRISGASKNSGYRLRPVRRVRLCSISSAPHCPISAPIRTQWLQVRTGFIIAG